MKYFDAHSHIQDERYNTDRDEVISRMRDAEVGALVVGTDRQMSLDGVHMAESYDFLFAAVGLHPTDRPEEVFDEKQYRILAERKKTRAIGECGLDYFRMNYENATKEKKRQRGVFESQIALAVALGKPLMIHCRNAHQDLLALLEAAKREHGERLFGNVHFFSEGSDTAKKYFDLDFSISFTGVITFTSDYDEALRSAPKDKILAETDCPYVAPIPYRGKRNEPVFIKEVVKRMSEIRGEELEETRAQLLENSRQLFGL